MTMPIDLRKPLDRDAARAETLAAIEGAHDAHIYYGPECGCGRRMDAGAAYARHLAEEVLAALLVLNATVRLVDGLKDDDCGACIDEDCAIPDRCGYHAGLLPRLVDDLVEMDRVEAISLDAWPAAAALVARVQATGART